VAKQTCFDDKEICTNQKRHIHEIYWYSWLLQHTETHCSTVQHTAAQCNTPKLTTPHHMHTRPTDDFGRTYTQHECPTLGFGLVSVEQVKRDQYRDQYIPKRDLWKNLYQERPINTPLYWLVGSTVTKPHLTVKHVTRDQYTPKTDLYIPIRDLWKRPLSKETYKTNLSADQYNNKAQ